jgi:hypothetical protein
LLCVAGQLLGDPCQGVEQVLHAGPGDADGEDQQHGVDRRLVDLDAVPVHQHVLTELEPVHPGPTQVEGDPGGVEHELVVPPRLFPTGQVAVLGLLVGDGCGPPVGLGHQIGSVQDAEPRADLAVRGDAVPERQRHPVSGAHTCMTCSGLTTTPSKVQLVSSSIRTRCSSPAASRSSRVWVRL